MDYKRNDDVLKEAKHSPNWTRFRNMKVMQIAVYK